jgi:hypothetical protein
MDRSSSLPVSIVYIVVWNGVCQSESNAKRAPCNEKKSVTGYRAVIQRYAKAHNYPPICIKRGKEGKRK